MTEWTAEDENILRAEWPNFSASQLSELLGRRYTRNAVIGKASRMKLDRKAIAAAPKPRRVPSPRQYKPRLPVYNHRQYRPRLPDYNPVEHTPTPTHILDLNRWHCRAVIGKPIDLTFCGGHAPDGSSWCDAHKAIYVRPVHERTHANWRPYRSSV